MFSKFWTSLHTERVEFWTLAGKLWFLVQRLEGYKIFFEFSLFDLTN